MFALSYYMEKSAIAGNWNLRFNLLAKRLRGRPEATIRKAILALAVEEHTHLDPRWVDQVARTLADGHIVSLN